MDQEPDLIRRQIDETRSSLTDKLETLEGQVRETVQNVKERVESVKRSVNLKYQVEQHPWAMIGGMALAGFAFGTLVSKRPRSSTLPTNQFVEPTSNGAAVSAPVEKPEPAPGLTAKPINSEQEPNLLSWALHECRDEIQQVKEEIARTAVALVCDLIKYSLPIISAKVEETLTKPGPKESDNPPARSPAESEVGF